MKSVNVSTVDVVNVKINGIACRAPAGSTILEAAHAAGIAIPTLCYLKELNPIGACRICVVEVKGAKGLVPACVYPIAEGMGLSVTLFFFLRNYRKLIKPLYNEA